MRNPERYLQGKDLEYYRRKVGLLSPGVKPLCMSCLTNNSAAESGFCKRCERIEEHWSDNGLTPWHEIPPRLRLYITAISIEQYDLDKNYYILCSEMAKAGLKVPKFVRSDV